MSLLLACLALAAVGADESTPAEFAAVPRNAFAMVHLRPADLWASDAAVKLRRQFPIHAAGLVAELGEDPADLESATLVFPTPASLEPFLGDLFESFHNDPFPIYGDPLMGEIQKAAPKKKDEAGSITANKLMMIVTTVKPYDQAKVAEMVLGKDSIANKHNGKTYYTAHHLSRRQRLNDALYYVNDRTYLFASPPDWVKKIIDAPATKDARNEGPLSVAVDLAGKKHHLVAGVNLTETAGQEWKKQFMDASSRPQRMEPVWSLFPLLEATSATLAVDVGPGQNPAGNGKANDAKSIRVQATFTFPDAPRALGAEPAGQDLLSIVRIFTASREAQRLRVEAEQRDDPETPLFWMLLAKQAESALREGSVVCRATSLQLLAQRSIDIDALLAKAKTDAKILLADENARKLRDLGRQMRIRADSAENLQRIVSAMLTFSGAQGSLPPAAICDRATGKPLLSWRVAILPYLGEHELYRQFKLDEAWDGPHNVKLLAKMPRVYLPEGVPTKEPNTTCYQALVGPDAVFRLKPQKGSPFGAVGIKISDIGDGLANTIGVVEADAVPWTKPVDLVYDGAKPLPKLGGVLFKNGFHVAFLDGTVRFLATSTDEATLRALITPNGGEPIDREKLREP